MVATVLRNASESANALAKRIGAELGNVSVAATTDSDGSVVLRVWSREGARLSNLPKTFNGYQVRVEPLPIFKAETGR